MERGRLAESGGGNRGACFLFGFFKRGARFICT